MLNVNFFTLSRFAKGEQGAEVGLFRSQAVPRQVSPGPLGDRQIPHHGPGTYRLSRRVTLESVTEPDNYYSTGLH